MKFRDNHIYYMGVGFGVLYFRQLTLMVHRCGPTNEALAEKTDSGRSKSPFKRNFCLYRKEHNPLMLIHGVLIFMFLRGTTMCLIRCTAQALPEMFSSVHNGGRLPFFLKYLQKTLQLLAHHHEISGSPITPSIKVLP
ncbi:hypothetical protein CEXT_41811 [Caerostris extrusa]|uniref:Uncharacterized protein n=1 Tax=Caerostris extrusa TaxID=172846 RepID=A0AAV4NLB4_CAEEX|nr:hypothetical protein CEXT_41811 [Caerostris extrusa]